MFPHASAFPFRPGAKASWETLDAYSRFCEGVAKTYPFEIFGARTDAMIVDVALLGAMGAGAGLGIAGYSGGKAAGTLAVAAADGANGLPDKTAVMSSGAVTTRERATYTV
jgi:hypothetical protein